MLTWALLLLATAVLGGFVLASNVLRWRSAPWVVSIGHGLLATTGVVVLAVALVQGAQSTRATVALVLFALALLGGLHLGATHLRHRLSQRWVVYLHAAMALAGILVLFAAVVA